MPTKKIKKTKSQMRAELEKLRAELVRCTDARLMRSIMGKMGALTLSIRGGDGRRLGGINGAKKRWEKRAIQDALVTTPSKNTRHPRTRATSK